MAAHYPNIHLFQAPTIYLSTVHEAQTTLQELLTLRLPDGTLLPSRQSRAQKAHRPQDLIGPSNYKSSVEAS